MYYYVVFNGFHLTEQKITSYSKNDKASDLVKFLEFLSVATVSFLTPDRIFSLIQNNIDISDVSYFLRLPVKLVDFTVQRLPQIK